ncbi:TonB-dependent receptor plug domain-containing protein [Pseudemcibacter aquimaris]|uniref:TonB-dependent receptor plug domain-containing protein n=1 Tax=Pseudemcibacter aquimaris TaxID=2857064 RepID=UPI002011337A|nr:TonB-dependent receptor [Pseudemcibacter aquimaris]MCC3859814.1 TonB-dependent receptor plug domain-containing protein [Pseudemcibacter aquimaris]WDU60208.1 outer membrane beta-barrel protein [Pseudemcibacter aquimaris]
MYKKILVPFLLSTTMLSTAFAAEEAVDGSIVTYDKDYFVKFAPVTLIDMMSRIPGVQEILNRNRQQRMQARRGGGGADAQGGRGFGNGGDQILINGKRVAGKNANINDILQRVSADQVEKIDLIRGAASGLDVQSQGLVINIHLKEGASTSSTFYRLMGRYFRDRKQFVPEVLVSHSGAAENGLQYTFTGEFKNTRRNYTRDEWHYDGTESFTGERYITNDTISQSMELSSNLSYSFEDGSDLRLNGLFSKGVNDRYEIQQEIGLTPFHRLWDTDNDITKWEIGGDYTKNLGDFGSLKALFVINNEDSEQLVLRDLDYDTDNQYRNAEETTLQDKSEKIFRASLTKGIFSDQTLEIGGETAINNFNKDFSNLSRGSAEEILTLGANDKVEIQENRYEVFANHTYNFSSKLVLSTSLVTEFSKIVADSITTGDQRDTSFTYFKPRMNLRYDFTSSDQLRLTAEKKVSQLDFNNFVTRYDQRAEQLVFGNTEIRPEQLWEFSAVFEHRLPNDGGALEAEIFYRDYDDRITLVDFTEYNDIAGNPLTTEEFFALPTADLDMLRDSEFANAVSFISKSGNIDGATAKGVKLKGNVRLGFIGLPEAVLGGSYVYEKRREMDQFILQEVNFPRASDHTYSINYRHDVTAWNFSYGAEVTIKSEFTNRERNYTWPWKLGPMYKIFAEKVLPGGYKLIGELWQIDMGSGDSTLTIYNDHRRFNDVFETMVKDHTSQNYFRFMLQGTF